MKIIISQLYPSRFFAQSNVPDIPDILNSGFTTAKSVSESWENQWLDLFKIILMIIYMEH